MNLILILFFAWHDLFAKESFVFGCDKKNVFKSDKIFINQYKKESVCSNSSLFQEFQNSSENEKSQKDTFQASIFMGNLIGEKQESEISYYFEVLKKIKFNKKENDLLNFYKKEHDPIFFHLLVFLKYLPNLYAVQNIEAKVQDGLHLSINAQSKSSNYKIDISIIETNLKKTNLSYKKLINDAFLNSDLISYLGHADEGRNLKFYSLIDQKNIKRSKPLSLGIFSCNAIEKFDDDLFVFLKNSNNVLLTTTDETAGARFILGQLILFESKNLGFSFFKEITPLNKPFIITYL